MWVGTRFHKWQIRCDVNAHAWPNNEGWRRFHLPLRAPQNPFRLVPERELQGNIFYARMKRKFNLRDTAPFVCSRSDSPWLHIQQPDPVQPEGILTLLLMWVMSASDMRNKFFEEVLRIRLQFTAILHLHLSSYIIYSGSYIISFNSVTRVFQSRNCYFINKTPICNFDLTWFYECHRHSTRISVDLDGSEKKRWSRVSEIDAYALIMRSRFVYGSRPTWLAKPFH